MELANGSTPFDRVELSDQFHLQKADKQEWVQFYSIYYNAEHVRMFTDENILVQKNLNVLWIYEGRSKIGGVILSPNLMRSLYFIPPFNQQHTIVRLLKDVLLKYSDATLPIYVYEVLQDQVELFARAGFWPDEHRYRWMQRPTESLVCEWDEQATIIKSIIEDTQTNRSSTNDKEIGHLFYRCHPEYIWGMNSKQQSISHYITETQTTIKEANTHLLRASTLVYDKRNNALIAACLLSMNHDIPRIQHLGILPTYRRRGIGTNMIKRSLGMLTDHYPYLRVYVQQGNPVESMYYNLGFMAGPVEIRKMLIPVK